jgi:hypothetical protein
MPQAPDDAYAALRIPAFRTFTLTRFLLTVAIQIQSVAVGLHIYYVTKNPLSLGLIGLSEALPSIRCGALCRARRGCVESSHHYFVVVDWRANLLFRLDGIDANECCRT